MKFTPITAFVAALVLATGAQAADDTAPVQSKPDADQQQAQNSEAQMVVQLTNAYLGMPELQNMLAKENAQYFESCDSSEISSVDGLIVLEPFQRNAEGEMSKGAWKVQYTASGCDQTKSDLNLVLVSDPANQRVAPIATLPGGSAANPQLQHDALLAVFPTAMAAMEKDEASCGEDSPLVTDTMLESKPDDAKSWVETWQVRYCGEVAMVPVAFSPDGKGNMSFSVKSEQITFQ